MTLKTTISLVLVLVSIAAAEPAKADRDSREMELPRPSIDPGAIKIDIGSLPVIVPDGI